MVGKFLAKFKKLAGPRIFRGPDFGASLCLVDIEVGRIIVHC